MPQDYILHKIERGETISSLAQKYGVEEHKIVAANPDAIELIRLEDRWEIRISEDSIIKIPQGEEEATAFIIKGNTSLGMGKTEEFELLTREEGIPRFPSEKISWDFSVEEGGSWRKLQLPQEKIGQKISIVFKNQKLKSKSVQLEVYIERENGKEKLSELLIALDGEDQAEISKLELLDVNRNLIRRPLSYAETLFARAQCTGMEGETLYFSLWEDDARGKGHNTENEQNFISTKEAEVVNGLAEASFPLLLHSMGPIANQKVAAGQTDEGKHHEYYVTATRYEGGEVESSSQNVDVNNPDYIPPTTPELIHRDRVNATARPPATAWKEPKIIKVYIRDAQGREWTRRPKFGEKIRVHIQSENLINKKINVKLYDKDLRTDDLLYNKDWTIGGDLCQAEVTLTKEMQDIGGDILYQNIFAEVSLYGTRQTVQSEVIDVDRINFHIPRPEGVRVVTRNAPEKKEGEEHKCPRCDKDITLEEIKKTCTIKNNKGNNVCLIKDDSIINAALPYLNLYRKKVGINTCIRKAHFLAQIAGETKFYILQEGFTYSNWKRLRGLFPSYFKQFPEGETRDNEAKRLANAGKDENSQKIVANAIYGKTHPLGREHTNSNDGWRYSGKGFKQITWKDNYKKLQKYFNENMKIGNEVDIQWIDDNNPYKLKNKTKDAITSALAYWGWKNINSVAIGTTDTDVNNTTYKINASTSEDIRKPRREYFKKAVQILKVDECTINSSKKQSFNFTFDGKYTAKSNEVYINVITPKSRDLQGPLIVFDNTGVLFKTHSLCRGSNSNRLKAAGNGDTPTGRATTRYAPKSHNGEYSFGNHGLVYLEGESGDFLTASKNGRAGIAIHSGHTSGYYKRSLEDLGKLMGTYGCIRVYNEEMKNLGELYTKLKNQGKTIYCYIEDYNGNISDVYKHYEIEIDSKDSSRGKRSTTQ